MKFAEEILSMVISSDNTNHTKNEIACCVYKILSKIPSAVEVLKIWSDGPFNQFKNRYIAALLVILEKRFSIKIYWNFFATSHGKGNVDGIGAAVKNRVRRLVKSRKAIVNSSKDFVDAFNTESSVIDLVDFPDSEMMKIFNELKLDDVFSSAPPIPNISNFHQLQVINGRVVGFSTSAEGYGFSDKLR